MREGVQAIPGLIGAALGVLGAAVVTWVVVSVILPAPAPVPTSTSTMIITLSVVVILALWVAADTAHRRGGRFTLVSHGIRLLALQLAAVVPVAAWLRGTGRYLNGIQGDQLFRLALAEKYSAYWTPVDTYFSDLPSFYPGLWFWGLGRMSAVTGLEVVDLYAYYNLATLAVAVTINYLLWIAARVNNPGLHALATATVGASFAAYEPYSWVLLAQSLPLILLLFRVLEDHGTRTRRELVAVGLIAGLIGGVALSTYTLAALFAALVVVIALLMHGGRIHWLSVALVTAVGAVVSAGIAAPWWWGFLVHDSGGAGHGNAAADYNPEVGASLAAAFQQPVPWVFLAAAGLAAVVFLHRRDPVVSASAVAVYSAGAWYVLSAAVYLATDSTLLAFRGIPVLFLALAVAAVHGARARVVPLDHQIPRVRRGVPTVLTALLGAVLLQAAPGDLAAEVEGARASAGADHTQEVVRCLREGTGDRDLTGMTVASTDAAVAVYAPVWTVSAPVVEYTNPHRDLAVQKEFIDVLDRDGVDVAARAFGVDAFVFSGAGGQEDLLGMWVVQENNEPYGTQIARSEIPPDWWTANDCGGFIVAVAP